MITSGQCPRLIVQTHFIRPTGDIACDGERSRAGPRIARREPSDDCIGKRLRVQATHGRRAARLAQHNPTHSNVARDHPYFKRSVQLVRVHGATHDRKTAQCQTTAFVVPMRPTRMPIFVIDTDRALEEQTPNRVNSIF
eukprot:1189148-Prorocentrum_minimum.AAC.5